MGEQKQMKIFEYAVILHPTENERERGETSEIIVEPGTCLANDLSQATMMAGRAIPEEFMTKLDRVEVAVRPF